MAGGTMTGSGTLIDPYQVEDALDLKAIESYGYDKYYLQVNDFILGTFEPVGYGSGAGYTNFTGSYDGGNYTISNGDITVVALNYSNGIFAATSGATISNMVLDNIDGVFSNNGGLLVGRAVSSTISNITVKNGSVNWVGGATNAYISCLVGYNDATDIDDVLIENMLISSSELGYAFIAGRSLNSCSITNCIVDSDSALTGSDGTAGGIVGRSDSSVSIEKCLNEASISSGTIVGGIVGYHTGGTISNCHNKGTIVSSGTNAGGITGYSVTPGIIEYSLNEGNVTCTNYGGGIVGRFISGTIRYSYALNTAITRLSGTSTDFGRISGASGGTETSNYALSTMTMNT